MADILIVYFIRVAATNAHDFLTAAHETLQDVVIADSLTIDQIINDFVPVPKQDSILIDILKIIAPGFSMSDKVVKQKEFNPSPRAGQQGDLLAFIGGAIAIAAGDLALNSVPQVDISQLTRELENHLADLFTETNENIAVLDSELFGGDGNISLTNLIDFVSSANGYTPDSQLQPITQAFSTGAFLTPLDQSVLKDGISAGFQLIKQQLVAQVLVAQDYFVFLNTDSKESDCSKITGSRFINNQCFTVEQRTQTHDVCSQDSKPIDAALILKFDDPNAGYNIDLVEFYQNVQACNNGDQPHSLDIDSDYPKCAFGMAFISAAGSVCNAVGTPNIPDSLQIDQTSCEKNECSNTAFFDRTGICKC